MTAAGSEMCLSVGLLLLAAISVATSVYLAGISVDLAGISVDLGVTDPSEGLLLVAAE